MTYIVSKQYHWWYNVPLKQYYFPSNSDGVHGNGIYIHIYMVNFYSMVSIASILYNGCVILPLTTIVRSQQQFGKRLWTPLLACVYDSATLAGWWLWYAQHTSNLLFCIYNRSWHSLFHTHIWLGETQLHWKHGEEWSKVGHIFPSIVSIPTL